MGSFPAKAVHINHMGMRRLLGAALVASVVLMSGTAQATVWNCTVKQRLQWHGKLVPSAIPSINAYIKFDDVTGAFWEGYPGSVMHMKDATDRLEIIHRPATPGSGDDLIAKSIWGGAGTFLFILRLWDKSLGPVFVIAGDSQASGTCKVGAQD